MLPYGTDQLLRTGHVIKWHSGNLSVLTQNEMIEGSKGLWNIWCDAAWVGDVKKVSVGAWVKDPDGNHIASMAMGEHCGSILNSYGAEVFALWKAAELAKALEVKHIQFNFDCLPMARKAAVALLENKEAGLEGDLVSSMKSFETVVFSWLDRSENLMADRLSKLNISKVHRKKNLRLMERESKQAVTARLYL